MTSNEFYRRQAFGLIQKPVSILRFRFRGSSHWWTEYFEARPYVKTRAEFAGAMAPFCELDYVNV